MLVAEVDRVLVAMKGRVPSTVYRTELTTKDGRLIEAAKLMFKSWFDTHADSEGKMDQAAMAQWVEKAAKTECAVDDVRVTAHTRMCTLASAAGWQIIREFANLGRSKEGWLSLDDFYKFFESTCCRCLTSALYALLLLKPCIVLCANEGGAVLQQRPNQ